MNALMAWIPFITPLNWMQGVWYLLLIPLAFGISVTYKAIRVTNLRTYWNQVFIMTLQIIFGIAALGILLMIFVRYILPLL